MIAVWLCGTSLARRRSTQSCARRSPFADRPPRRRPTGAGDGRSHRWQVLALFADTPQRGAVFTFCRPAAKSRPTATADVAASRPPQDGYDGDAPPACAGNCSWSCSTRPGVTASWIMTSRPRFAKTFCSTRNWSAPIPKPPRGPGAGRSRCRARYARRARRHGGDRRLSARLALAWPDVRSIAYYRQAAEAAPPIAPKTGPALVAHVDRAPAPGRDGPPPVTKCPRRSPPARRV